MRYAGYKTVSLIVMALANVVFRFNRELGWKLCNANGKLICKFHGIKGN